MIVKDYQGNAHGHGVRYSDGQQSAIFSIDDRVSGFKMLTDNGIESIDEVQHGSGSDCHRRKAGSYYYEHNQDGHGNWSASVSIGVFGISYNGASGSTLRKAAKFHYFN